MNNIAQKLEYIKWLKSIGIEYYFSSKKDSDISFINELKPHYNKLPGIGSEEIMFKKSTIFLEPDLIFELFLGITKYMIRRVNT